MDAEKTILQLESVEKSNAKPDNKRMASSARKLGTALLHNGRADEAMKAFERAAQIAETCLRTGACRNRERANRT